MEKLSRLLLALIALVVLGLAACGDDEGDGGTSAPTTSDAPVANACPAAGCTIEILEVVKSGDELEVTWQANFAPDVSRNHIHIYWDTFTAAEVSSDAEANGLVQGDWSPTDAYPTYITESGASVANRGASTTLCVTAADRDHAVIDSAAIDCMDVGAEL